MTRCSPLSIVGVETISGDSALSDGSDAALPRECPRTKAHHRFLHGDPVEEAGIPEAMFTFPRRNPPTSLPEVNAYAGASSETTA